jgi:hypothetical protein
VEQIADAIHADEAKQPHSQQNEPDSDEHLASCAPPEARKTEFRRDAVRSLASEGMWLDVKDHVGTGAGASAPCGTESRGRATNGDGPTAQFTSSGRIPTQDGGPTIQQPAADSRCTLRLPSLDQYMPRALARESQRTAKMEQELAIPRDQPEHAK